MNKPIRILQILGIVGGGGVESVIMNYYEHIDRNRVQFDFVVHDDNKIDITEKINSLGGKVYKVPAYNHDLIGFMRSVYRIIKENNYQIVHSNMNTLSAFPLFAAWLAGARVRILHNHSTSVPSETKRNILKIILRPIAKLFANKYFACSKFAAEWMYGKKCVESGKVTIINNAINLEMYAFTETQRTELRNKLGINNQFVVGHVGRFMYQKNHEFLIDVFAETVKLIPNAKLLLVGDGPLKNGIKSKIDRMGLGQQVIFLGIQNDVGPLYSVMDAFCFPSRYEGLGMVVVEAQASGLPIVMSTKVPKEAIVLNEIVTRCSLKTDRAEVWAYCLNKIYQRKDRKRSVETDKFFKAGFNIDDEAKKLIDIYYEGQNEENSFSHKSI